MTLGEEETSPSIHGRPSKPHDDTSLLLRPSASDALTRPAYVGQTRQERAIDGHARGLLIDEAPQSTHEASQRSPDLVGCGVNNTAYKREAADRSEKGQYRYFLDGSSIAQEIIERDICKYLGGEATVRPAIRDVSAAYLEVASRVVR